MNFSIALKLGRVSNLPTVWTNVLAGTILAGGSVLDVQLVAVLIALSLFYIGGMFLNDGFDAVIDARERPERPIPSAQVRRTTVFVWGFAMLAIAIILLLWIGYSSQAGLAPALAGSALAACIVFYNFKHKQNPFSPLIMGLCRLFVYIIAAACVAQTWPDSLLWGAGLLMCYLIGMTYVAKQENLGQVKNLWPLIFLAAPLIYGMLLMHDVPLTGLFWLAFGVWVLVALYFVKRHAAGDIPRAVVSLIAGISLYDAMLIAAAGEFGFALLAGLGFILTRVFQRYVSGT